VEHKQPSRAFPTGFWLVLLAVAGGYSVFMWRAGGWPAVLMMWLPFLVFFGPVILAVKCGWRSLGKCSDGRRPWWATVIFAPYLLLIRGTFELVRLFSREPAFAVVAPNLAFGRRLTNAEARRTDFASVLDLTAEFTEVSHFRSRPGFLALPVFDDTAPTPEQLRFAIAWIGEAVKRGPVYVHCALGHGRSACVVLAYLLDSRTVATVADGVCLLRGRRPKMKLTRGQKGAVRPFVRDAVGAADV